MKALAKALEKLPASELESVAPLMLARLHDADKAVREAAVEAVATILNNKKLSGGERVELLSQLEEEVRE